MISPELLRRYPFFAGLDHDQIVTLAKLADEKSLEIGRYIFHEGDELTHFYLIVEGAVALLIGVPNQDTDQDVAGQLTGEYKTNDVVVSAVGTGNVFGWSALVPPTRASAGAKALTHCRVIAFDAEELVKIFEEDCRFGYLVVQKVTQIIRERLRDMRIESLAFIADRVV